MSIVTPAILNEKESYKNITRSRKKKNRNRSYSDRNSFKIGKDLVKVVYIKHLIKISIQIS